MILTAKLALEKKPLLGPPMPDRLKVMTQKKRDNLVLQIGGWAWGANHTPQKCSEEKI
jgi:hypothetical protein